MIDTKAIEEHIRGILIALGDDPDREGLKETPQRVARMYEEVFEGMNYTNHEIAEMFNKTFEEKVIQSIKEKLNNEDLDSNSIKITFDKEYNIGSISIKNIKNINKKIVNEVNIGNSKKEESTKVLSQEKKDDLIDYFSKTYNVSKSKVTLD